MPCENCNVQFTVFRRKRTCHECKRFYCSNCLTTLKRNLQIFFLCERCAIFAKRPLLRTDLLQLKPKDLIFYLQSKHISTRGCVEKDELIRLVLNHVDQLDAGGSHQQQQHQRQQQQQSEQIQNNPNDSSANSFDSLRQTCQNFFFNISENISDSLASFDSKSKQQHDNNNVNANSNGSMPNGRRQRSNSTNPSTTTTTPTTAAASAPTSHIIDQPRVSRREIPTYASSLNSSNADGGTQQQQQQNFTPTTTIIINDRSASTNINPKITTAATTTNNSRNQSSSDEQKTSTSSSLASAISSIASQAQQTGATTATGVGVVVGLETNLNVPKLSDCECSDDELFANYAETTNYAATPPQQRQAIQRTLPTTVDNLGDEVSHSSFEELGAVGCSTNVVSDDSKCTEDSAGSSNTEVWQFLEPTTQNQNVETTSEATVIKTEVSPEKAAPTQRKKLLRRRSDRQRSSSVSEEINSGISTVENKAVGEEDDLVTSSRAPPPMLETSTTTTTATTTESTASTTATTAENDAQYRQSRRRSGTCRRCGKSNIRRYIEKLRQHLESAQMSEADIKREMNEFLAYLDEQTRSVDYSETETSVSPLSIEPTNAGGGGVGGAGGIGVGFGDHIDDGNNVQIVLSPTGNNRPPFFIDFTDDNDGIHVYGAEASSYSMEHNPRFVNIREFGNVDDLESLTVKQLKEVLMLHRVDYKGCCEKQELLERVQRLWKDLKSSPAVEKLATDELCKICMDAPIDCVILECGHMATCTRCGKVLSECPICRQYIVRVVHTFRA